LIPDMALVDKNHNNKERGGEENKKREGKEW